MLRIGSSAIVAVHGLIHLIGFVVPFQVTRIEGFPYRTTALNGSLTLGDAGARGVGVVWLALALGFLIAAFGIWRARRWALPLTAGLAAPSIVVCALGLPEAVAGVAVNVVILGALTYLGIVKRHQRSTRP